MTRVRGFLGTLRLRSGQAFETVHFSFSLSAALSPTSRAKGALGGAPRFLLGNEPGDEGQDDRDDDRDQPEGGVAG
jgi:hypothetical protein